MSEAFDRTRLIAELEEHERFVPYAYPDSEGYWTIGFGRMIDGRLGGGVTKEEGLYLLNRDIDKAKATVSKIEPRWTDLTPERQRVLLNMAHNLGYKRLAGFVKMWDAIREYLDGAGDDALNRAAYEMRHSKWADQVGKRAEQLAKIMEKTSDSTVGYGG